MPNDQPPPPTAGPDEPPGADDPIRRLEQRLDRASATAERLIAEAAAGRKPPPAGWQAPPRDGESSSDRELELLTQLIHSLRELVPPELERRLAEALHELLLALRAVIDYYIERLERPSATPTEVEDIPIA
jgi:hypothetical protein